MSENNKKWKSRLLSSSIPLEFETAKILSEFGFSVSYDYTFYRKEGSENKEFSVDINGLGFLPFNNENQVDASVIFLIECKYRDEGKMWLFLPETECLDYSTQVLGYAIRTIDSFTKTKLNKDSIYNLEGKLEFGLKGIEINEKNGEVFDKDIRHGLYQLKYSLPNIIKDSLESNLYGHIEDAKPWFIVPILLTNADLHMLNDNFTMGALVKAETIDSISKKVPYLIYYSDINPDFTEHHERIFTDFYSENKNNKNLLAFEDFQKSITNKKYEGMYNSPIKEAYGLEKSFQSQLSEYYSHFFVCSFENFKVFVTEITKTIEEAMKK